MRNKIIVLALTTTIISQGAYALPTGGTVTNGDATIVTSGKAININQTTSRADIDWATFGAAAHESINFNQPDATSITINRVTGGLPSVFASTSSLNAPGRVVILNDAGMTFAKGSQINTGALIASTAKDYNLTDDQLNLSNLGHGVITNDGIITAKTGSVTILADKIVNSGTITARDGAIDLLSGKDAQFSVSDGSLNYQLNPQDQLITDSGITSSGKLTAKSVAVTTQQLNDIHAGVINLSGVIDTSLTSATDPNSNVSIYSSGDINSKATIKTTAGSLHYIDTVAKGTNNFSGNYKSDDINVTGHDIGFHGTTSNYGGAKGDTALNIAADNDLVITNAASSAKDRVSQAQLEGITARTKFTGLGSNDGSITMNNLADYNLRLSNNVVITGEKGVTVLAKNNVISTTGTLAILSDGNIKTGALTSKQAIHVIGNDIETGSITLNNSVLSTAYNENPSTLVTIAGRNVKTGNITTSMKVAGGTGGTTFALNNISISANADNNGEGGALNVGNISSNVTYGNAASPKVTTEGNTDNSISLTGKDVSYKNLTVKSATYYTSGIANAEVAITGSEKVTQAGNNSVIAQSQKPGVATLKIHAPQIDSGLHTTLVSTVDKSGKYNGGNAVIDIGNGISSD